MMTSVYIDGQSVAITTLLRLIAVDDGYTIVFNAGAADVLVTETLGEVLVESAGGRGVSVIAKPFDLSEFRDALLRARGSA